MENGKAKKKTAKFYVNLAALRWAMAQTEINAGPARNLFHFLASKSDEFGCCWYAQRTLGEELGITDRSIRKHLKPLEQKGLVRIVHRTRGGYRATNVYQLIGWSGRKQLPKSGHPIAGLHVVETPTSLEQLSLKRNRIPHHAENGAVLNKYTEENTTTDEEKAGALYICLEALGPWATEKNARALTRSSKTLFELLERGFDLYRHVLPTIKSMVRSRARIPILVSWSYFADAIARFAEKNPLPKKCETQTDNKVALTGSSFFETESQFEKSPGNYSVDYLRAVAERRRFGSLEGGRS